MQERLDVLQEELRQSRAQLRHLTAEAEEHERAAGSARAAEAGSERRAGTSTSRSALGTAQGLDGGSPLSLAAAQPRPRLEVGVWLSEHGLAHLGPALRSNRMCGGALQALAERSHRSETGYAWAEAVLREQVGITALGDRLRLLGALPSLQDIDMDTGLVRAGGDAGSTRKRKHDHVGPCVM